MKKRVLVTINIIVCLIIFIGFLMITYLNDTNFNEILEDDIENISRLSSSTIYAQIDNSLTKPIFVGKTMANDIFLKNWLSNEKSDGYTIELEKLIEKYLNNYKINYNYDSVFLVSANTGIYYHHNGINKIVTASDKHDIWYYDFIDSNESYKLDVDIDEANNNQLTVFVNCRVEAPDGALLGVVGVGVKMNHFQELLKKYETGYNLKAFLINENGTVQVDSDSENIETVNFFDNKDCFSRKNQILNNRTSAEIYWYPDNSISNCVISQYIENLDWFIIIQKDTIPVKQMLTEQFKIDLLYITIIILLVLLFSIIVINSYKRLLLTSATTDDVTNLPNIKMFYELYRRNAKKVSDKNGTFFMFDIDHFKKINDRYGHVCGNTVLYEVSNIVKNIIGNNGIVARFGGDEFIGVIYAPDEDAAAIMQLFCSTVAQSKYTSNAECVTISVGATHITSGNKIEVLIKESDSAMYQSKINGRNQIAFYEK